MFGKDNKRVNKRNGQRANDTAPEGFSPEECDEVLNRIPFFAKLRPVDRRNLRAVGVARAYPAGADLVHEGQRPGVGLYVILRGRVCITQRGEGDDVRMLATVGPGEMFGEMALIDDRPRSATATAIEPTLAFIIPIFDFRAVLQHSAEASAALLFQLSLRLRDAEEALRQ